MAETAIQKRNSEQWEQLRAANSVLMIRDMLRTDDEQLQKAIYEQVCDQEFSHIPEVLEGNTGTHFEFDSYNGRLFVLQPEGLADWLDIHENGVKRAQKKAELNERFRFYAEIAGAELEEAKAQLEMVTAGEPATMVVMSLDGSDLAGTPELKALGRAPEKKRAYLRAAVFDEGRLHLYSETYDGLTLDGAKHILAKQFGINLPAGANSIDILESRVKLPGAHHQILNQLVPKRGQNNYDFVLSQKDLLERHMCNLIGLAKRDLPLYGLACQADELRYNIMSSFKQKLEGSWTDLESLEQSIANAGMIERSLGTQFAGCDVVLTAQQDNLEKAGYFNILGPGLLVRKKFESKWCPNCLPKPKAGKRVKAWRQGDRIGCADCGHVVDVCTKKVVHQGRKPKTETKLWLW